MMTQTLQATMRRQRIIIGLGIAAIATSTWLYLVQIAIASEQGMQMTTQSSWNWHTFGLNLIMWCAMMVSMMLPTASPMIMSFFRVKQKRADSRLLSSVVFISGYLILWGVFSVLAAGGQAVLHNTDLLSSPMGKTGPLLGACLLITAGAFQWSSLKESCLGKCRSPLSFLLVEWRDGNLGALVMGLRHGFFCIGCCWALMLLMFVGGVMNLTWMALLAVYMLLEKIVPNGRYFSRISGVMLIIAGVWVLCLLP